MKFKSEVLTQASGSVGGVTYGHNRGGLYRRARSIPVNTNSPAQLAVRNNLASLANAWKTIVLPAQRDAWTAYAQNSPVTDVFGDPLVLSGQQMYVRCNSLRLRGGLARVDDGPTTFGLSKLTLPTIVSDVGLATQSISFDNTDEWAVATGGALIVQTSRVYDATKNYFRGPYRYLASIDGAGTPPTSPQDLGTMNAFGQDISNFAAGQILFYRVTASAPDGRCSPVYRIRVPLVEA